MGAAKELKSAGKFTIPGVCMVKTRKKPATPAGKREVFGKVVMVKAKPAKNRGEGLHRRCAEENVLRTRRTVSSTVVGEPAEWGQVGGVRRRTGREERDA